MTIKIVGSVDDIARELNMSQRSANNGIVLAG